MYKPTKTYDDAVAALQAEALRVVEREGPKACRAYLERLAELASAHRPQWPPPKAREGP